MTPESLRGHRILTEGVTKSFTAQRSGSVEVLSDINISVADGEFVSIIGPSGCGKSTLFNILAGLTVPDEGDIIVHGEQVTGTSDHFAYMPQKDLLLPWRRIIDNAALGLEVRGMRRKAAREAAGALFETFGLRGFERSWPHQLSGGMRQRAALLRTVVQGRDVLLLDEPFGALDSLTRTEMQTWLTRIWEKYHWTIVLITHDIREAVILSDRIYTMTRRPGRIQSEHVVDLPRPRSEEMFSDPRAVRLEADLMAGLRAAMDTPGRADPAVDVDVADRRSGASIVPSFSSLRGGRR